MTTVVHCYRDDGVHMGLGDFLRGSIAAADFCLRRGLEFKCNYSAHRLRDFLVASDAKEREPKIIVGHDVIAEHDREILTNMWPRQELLPGTLELVRQHCLTPTAEFEAFLVRRMSELGLEPKNYDVVHVRTGDRALVEGVTTDATTSIWSQVAKHVPTQNYLLSDSSQLLRQHQGAGGKTTSTFPSHLGFPQTPEAIRDTLLDVFLLARARRIYQFSCYDWGSGFSGQIALLYEVPLICHRI
jgi:hypothetical protein